MNPKDKLKIALLEFFLTETELIIFVIRADDKESGVKDNEPIVIKSDVEAKEVESLVVYLRSEFKKITYNKKKTEQVGMTQFEKLGNKIFTKTLYNYIEHCDALYLVPFADLHHLPMHAFKYEGKYIIDLFQIAYLPSASVLQYIKTKNPTNLNSKKTLLAVGVDYYDARKQFKHEAKRIYDLELWDTEKSVFLYGKNATKFNLLNESANKNVIHISTHGHFSQSDAFNSGIVLYNSDVTIENVEGTDIILSVTDIFENMTLDSELVVMSACVTGQSDNRPGDELIGLTRSLLYAGANSLIVSLFPIFKNITGHSTTKSDKALTPFSTFYKFWIGENLAKGKALQRYIQEIKKVYPHPFNWFSMILVGNIY